MEQEEIIFQLISNAGEASSMFFSAVKHAESGVIDEAEKLMEKGVLSLQQAHRMQTELIQKEAAGKRHEINILMVHAQDHLMNAMLLKEVSLSNIALNEKVHAIMHEIEELKAAR